jgi:hypothetical protein
VIGIAEQYLFYALFIWAMGFALSSKPATLVAGYRLIVAAIYGE